MSWNTSVDWQSFENGLRIAIERYFPFRSKDASNVMSSLEPLRPGDSSAPYGMSDADCPSTSGGDAVACVFGMKYIY